MLDWLQRGKRVVTQISERMTWATRDGRFAVAYFKPLLGGDISPYYLAIDRRGGERIISRHRTRNAAEDACEMLT